MSSNKPCDVYHKRKYVSGYEYWGILAEAKPVVEKRNIGFDYECHGFDNMRFVEMNTGLIPACLYQCEKCGKSYVLVVENDNGKS